MATCIQCEVCGFVEEEASIKDPEDPKMGWYRVHRLFIEEVSRNYWGEEYSAPDSAPEKTTDLCPSCYRFFVKCAQEVRAEVKKSWRENE